MKLSIIINFYNMRREAHRTLYSLTKNYQRGINNLTYEVICLDHGSTTCIDTNQSYFNDPAFQYEYIQTKSVSPCAALNAAVKKAKGEYVMVCIDGARMFSPRLVGQSLAAAKNKTNPFVFTLNAQLGHELQYLAVQKGYNQSEEDKLLAKANWQSNGYNLFKIACLGGSANPSSLTMPNESNTPMLKKQTFIDCGGYNEKFVSPGGGFANLEFFSRMVENPTIQPLLLLGEASFHQTHGGTITNATGPSRESKFIQMHEEYQRIVGAPYRGSSRCVQTYGASSTAWESLITTSVCSAQ